MKKNYLLICSIIPLLFSPLYGQVEVNGNELADEKDPKVEEAAKKSNHLWGLDFHYLGIGVHFAQRINKKLCSGGEFGILPDKLEWFIKAGQYFSENNTVWTNSAPEYNISDSRQLLYFHFFVRMNSNTERFELDFGIRRAYYKRLLPHFDDYSYPIFTGFYLKPVIGCEKLKIGLRIDMGQMAQKDGTIIDGKKELVLVGGVFIRLNL